MLAELSFPQASYLVQDVRMVDIRLASLVYLPCLFFIFLHFLHFLFFYFYYYYFFNASTLHLQTLQSITKQNIE